MSQRFWDRWLVAVAAGVIVFAASLVVLPQLSSPAFETLFARRLVDTLPFEADTADYLRFVYAVLGSVMIGWMVGLLFLITGPFRERTRLGWWAVSISVAVWFVTDSGISLWVGYWENAALNLAFLFLFAPPLVATRRVCLSAET